MTKLSKQDLARLRAAAEMAAQYKDANVLLSSQEVTRLLDHVAALEAENERLMAKVVELELRVDGLTPKRPKYSKPKAYTHKGPASDVWFNE